MLWAKILEVAMLVLFGISWPISLVKSITILAPAFLRPYHAAVLFVPGIFSACCLILGRDIFNNKHIGIFKPCRNVF